MTGELNSTSPQHPKDGFIADWKSLPEAKRAEFSNELIDRLFDSGFGVLNKKEVELAVLALLEEAGALGSRTNHELSMALGITETRVRNLLHSARLRHGISDEDYLRSRLPAMLTKMSAEIFKDEGGTERVRLIIEDALLQQALNARIKLAKGVPETSKEISVIKLDVFTEVVFGLIPEELQQELKKTFGSSWKSRLTRLIKSTVKQAAEESFKKQIALGSTPALVAAWNFALSHGDWLHKVATALGITL